MPINFDTNWYSGVARYNPDGRGRALNEAANSVSLAEQETINIKGRTENTDRWGLFGMLLDWLTGGKKDIKMAPRDPNTQTGTITPKPPKVEGTV